MFEADHNSRDVNAKYIRKRTRGRSVKPMGRFLYGMGTAATRYLCSNKVFAFGM
jgi:hypothetical protein